MTHQTNHCKECGGETTVTTLAPFSGREGSVTVTVDGMPAVVCARNHRRFLYAEFAPTLVDFVADSEKISARPPAQRRGVLRKRYHCGECGAELPVDATRASERSLDANFRKGAPFKVLVQVAVYVCERCGREHVRPREELADSAVKAVAHGFRAADVHADR